MKTFIATLAAVAAVATAEQCTSKIIDSCENPCSGARKTFGSYSFCMVSRGCTSRIDSSFTDGGCALMQLEQILESASENGCERDNIPACEDHCSILREISSYTLCMSTIGCWNQMNWQFQDSAELCFDEE